MSADSSNVKLIWQFEQSRAKWQKFPADQSELINAAFEKDSTEVTLPAKGQKAEINVDFGLMIQKDAKTKFERRVRSCVFDEKELGLFLWEYKPESQGDDKKTAEEWTYFPARDSFLLEKSSVDSQKTCAIDIDGQKAEADLDTEKATTNTKKDSFLIRRVLNEDAASSQVPDQLNGPKSALRKRTSARTASAKEQAATTSKDKDMKSVNGEAENEPPSKKKKSDAKSAVAKSQNKSLGVRTVLKKGKAPVDADCPVASKTHVYCEGKDIYDCMLNQTNLQNNNNKYYICQLLEDDDAKRYTVWFRWGRVGYGGRNTLTPCGPNLNQAKQTFCKKFAEKTVNEWADRKRFKKVAGKYDLVELDYNASTPSADTPEEEPETSTTVKKEAPQSLLDLKVQNLVQLICDVKAMEDAVVEMKYDTEKMPLGKLTVTQIKAGYSALRTIETCIEERNYGNKLVNACNEFYTRIPHYFGMSRPPLIRDEATLKAKINLLEVRIHSYHRDVH